MTASSASTAPVARGRGRRRPSPSSGVTRVHDRLAGAGSFGLAVRRAGGRRHGAVDGAASALAPAGARLATARAGSRRPRARARRRVGRAGFARTTPTAISRWSAGTAMAVTVADCVPVFIAHPSGAIGAAAFRLARHRRRESSSARSTRCSARGSRAATSCMCTSGRRSAVGATRSAPTSTLQLTGSRSPARRRPSTCARSSRDQARAAACATCRSSACCTRCDNDRFFSHRAGDRRPTTRRDVIARALMRSLGCVCRSLTRPFAALTF